MRISFLCCRHRDWLLEDRERAEKFWQNWIDDSIGEIDEESAEEDETQLIAQLGSAWELSYALLDMQYPDPIRAITRFGFSASLLCQALDAHDPLLSGEVFDVSECRLRALQNVRELEHAALSALAGLDMSRQYQPLAVANQ